MARKRFQASKRSPSEGDYEPVGFTIFGEKRVTEPDEDVKWVPHEQDFDCLPCAPAGIMTTFVRNAAPIEFIEGVISSTEEAARFRKLVFDKDFVVESDTIVEIVNYLVEEYSSRPTKRPTSSSPGPADSGNGSKVD